MLPDVSIDSPPTGKADVLLGLGSNMGDRSAFLSAAIEKIGLFPTCSISHISPVYETEPVGAAGGLFLNCAARITTGLSPRRLLEFIKDMERSFGRTGSGTDARPVDVDILFFGDVVSRQPVLTIPHPRWRERTFVLVPLLEICAGFNDPETGRPLQSIISAILETRAAPVSGVRRFAESELLKPAPTADRP